MYDAEFRKAYATVAWYERFRLRDYVYHVRGTGETGWWHQHKDEADCGGNPMDYERNEDKTKRAYVCRSCGERLSKSEADAAVAQNEV